MKADIETPKRLGSMDSPNVFRFRHMNFSVGKGDSKKYLLRDVSGTVKGGRKLHFVSAFDTSPENAALSH